MVLRRLHGLAPRRAHPRRGAADLVGRRLALGRQGRQGGWASSYAVPVQTNKTVAASPDTDDFSAGLGHEWEWNHNPDRTKWRLVGTGDGGGLALQTATVTADLFAARNTLTRRIAGPKSSGTLRLDVGAMADGDRAGAVLFRDQAAYVGVWKAGAAAKVVMVANLTLSESGWRTTSTGTVAATGPTLDEGAAEIWLRVEADITPAFSGGQTRMAKFFYSLDGNVFTQLGPAFPMSNSWRYFAGYRFGVFNHATLRLGGEVRIKSFTTQLVS